MPPVRTRAPDFWNPPAGLAAALLGPAATAWAASARLRRALTRPYRAPVPVICVGNLVAGGSGKTPVVLSLAAWFAERGVGVHIVSRGYGGRERGPLRVDALRHDAFSVGDEALLAAACAPAWIGRDRAAAMRAAANAGAAAILLDDGFQNPAVVKDVALLVVDAGYGFGNGRVIPAGPLREPVAAGLARAEAIVLIGDGAVPPALRGLAQPLVPPTLEPLDGSRFAGRKVLPFAGIGRPEKFFATLRAAGAASVATRSFPDHHPYRAGDLAALHRAAQAADATLVTTAKDWVRLPTDRRAGIEVLSVELRWHEPASLERLMMPVLQTAREHGRDAREPRG